VDRAADLLAGRRRLLVFTGSGMSAESGIPTFRGNEGLWEGARPEDVATPQAFARDPERVWRWYRDRILAHEHAQPNDGHRALAAMEPYFGEVLVATQNVDGLHEQAGSSDVVHLHGSMTRQRCNACGRRLPLTGRELAMLAPTCTCGGPMRPDITWFGEPLPQDAWARAEAFTRAADACLAVGSSHLVYPAASLPMAVKRSGGVLVEVNPESSGLTRLADVHVPQKAGEVLGALRDALARRAGRPKG
jgi:NAD-dependent deacetylase